MSAPTRLRRLLASPGIVRMPCCFDALSAKLVSKAGFPLTFASGFSISAAHGLPDTGLLSYGEMEATMRRITAATSLPCIGDGDTGYGNAVNVQRTVRGYASAGLAGIMIEDQVAPKRCGHTKEKAVVDRDTAVMRVRAAVQAAKAAAGEGNDPIAVVARTDARATHGLEEAVARAQLFREEGADILFVEAPRSIEEMRIVCNEVGGVQMANMLSGGLTPVLPPEDLEEIGFKLAAYPLDLLNASIAGMQRALDGLANEGQPPPEDTLPFDDLQAVVGFPEYYAVEEKYKLPDDVRARGM